MFKTLDKNTIEDILKIPRDTLVDPVDMAKDLKVTFYPIETENKTTVDFSIRLKESLLRLGVEIIPFEKSLITIPFKRIISRFFKICVNNFLFLFSSFFTTEQIHIYVPFEVVKNLSIRRRVKSGISIIVTGELIEDNLLPINITESFSKSSVITILDWPNDLKEGDVFQKHFDTAMAMFARNMTNIVLLVKEDKWLLYNFNASHPIFDFNSFDNNILSALIPKVYAPIKPMLLSEFKREKKRFDEKDEKHDEFVKDLVLNAGLLEKTGIYPKGKKISNLPFRNKYYKWIGSLHLDHRNGMSYGFLARQLPIRTSQIFFDIPVNDGKEYIKLHIDNKFYFMEVPEIEILTQRSGSDKTKPDPSRDVVKIGFRDNAFFVQTPLKLKLNNNIKTSFDTKVILAHAFGNAIIASFLKFRFGNQNKFVEQAEKKGFAITHWHGYINEKYSSQKFMVHGINNPHVACSSPQSAIYALAGKLSLIESVVKNGGEFYGDIHIEPHHGTNLTSGSIFDFANLLLENKDFTSLGNANLHFK
jgi:hypothetical protein